MFADGTFALLNAQTGAVKLLPNVLGAANGTTFITNAVTVDSANGVLYALSQTAHGVKKMALVTINLATLKSSIAPLGKLPIGYFTEVMLQSFNQTHTHTPHTHAYTHHSNSTHRRRTQLETFFEAVWVPTIKRIIVASTGNWDMLWYIDPANPGATVEVCAVLNNLGWRFRDQPR